MANIMTMSGLIFIALFFFNITFISASKVPVLIWSPTRSMSTLPQSLSGQTLGTEDFTSKYLDPLLSDGSHSLVVFLQDKLSLEDFTTHADVYNPHSDGGAFQNLKNFMDDDFSVHLPSVVSPANAIDTVSQGFKGKIHSVQAPFDVNSLDLDKGQHHLILVLLSPTSGESDEKAFSENDQQMAEVVKHLQKRGIRYTAVYTAQSSSKVSPDVASTGRHLLEMLDVEEGNYTWINESGCLFFFTRSTNLTVTTNTGGGFSVKFIHATHNESECGNGTARLNLNFEQDELTVTINMEIAMNNSWDWFLNHTKIMVKGKFNGTDYNGEAEMDMKELWAPKTFSYHCSSAGPFFNMTPTNDTEGQDLKMELRFDGIQFQPFNIRGDRFADPWDCVVFFSPGIWMAIVTVALMTIILLYGVIMITNINTMDRFDDPKGKTISVNVNE